MFIGPCIIVIVDEQKTNKNLRIKVLKCALISSLTVSSYNNLTVTVNEMGSH